MKKAKIFVWLLAIAAVLAAAGGVLYLSYRMPPEEAEAVIESAKLYCMERILPVAVAALAGVSAILGILSPVVRRVREAAGRFGEAVSSVQGTESASHKATEAMAVWKQESEARQEATLAAMEAHYTQELAALKAEQQHLLLSMQASQEAAIAGMWDAVRICVDRMDADHETVTRAEREARCVLDMLEAGLCNLPDVVASGAGVTVRRLAEQARVDTRAAPAEDVTRVDGKEAGAHGQAG